MGMCFSGSGSNRGLGLLSEELPRAPRRHGKRYENLRERGRQGYGFNALGGCFEYHIHS